MKRMIKQAVPIIMASVLLLSCGKKSGTETGTDSEDPGQLISLTAEQFISSGMVIGTAGKMSFEKPVRLNAYLKVPPQGMVSVGTLLPGEITYFPHSAGSHVNKGETLFRIRSLEIIRMQQEYIEAGSRLETLKADYFRQKDLSAEQIASEKTLMAAESEYLSMQAKFAALKSTLLLANIPLPEAGRPFVSELVVTSPVDGYITRTEAVTGQYVEPQSMVLELIDPGMIRLELNVYEKDVLLLEKGMEVRFFHPDNRERVYRGKLETVGKSVDPSTHTIPCYASLDGEDKSGLVNGMFMEAEIILSKREVIAVPAESVLKGSEKSYLLKVDSREGNRIRFSRIEVEPGELYMGYVEIQGIQEEDSVLVRGAYNLIVE
ncbi:MAG: efflux RND transporter periplasmic adaptor subunit [Bacteroidota bacterium]